MTLNYGNNSGNVDERIVEMRIDNSNFERGAKKTISLLEKLEKALKLDANTDAIDNIADSIDRFDTSPMTSGLDKVVSKFNILEAAGRRVIENLTDSIYQFATKTVHQLTLEQPEAGWGKYEKKTEAVQTIMAATRDQFSDEVTQMETINALLDKMLWYTDETSYDFTAMVDNAGKFLSAGVDLEDAFNAMMGIASWGASAGAKPAEVSRAMYNISQAMGQGAMTLQDWKSIENANMATLEFKQNVIEIAKAKGLLKEVMNTKDPSQRGFLEAAGLDPKRFKEYEDGLIHITKFTEKEVDSLITALNFRESLSNKWFSKELMTEVFKKYGQFADQLYTDTEETGLEATNLLEILDEYRDSLKDSRNVVDWKGWAEESTVTAEELERIVTDLHNIGIEYSENGFRMGQEAKTFTDAIEATKDAVSSGWMKTFELIFGDYLEAKSFWTDVTSELWDIFASGGETRNDILKEWKLDGGRDALLGSWTEEIDGETKEFKGALWNIVEAIHSVTDPIHSAFAHVFGLDTNSIADTGKALANLTWRFRDFTERLILSEDAQSGIKNTFSAVFKVIKSILSVLKPATSLLGKIIVFAKDLFDIVLSMAAGPLDAINRFFDLFFGISSVLIGEATSGLDRFSKIFETVVRRVSSAFSRGGIIFGFSTLRRVLAEAISHEFPELYDFLYKVRDAFSFLITPVEYVFNLFNSGFTFLRKAFIKIESGFKRNGLQGAITAITDGIQKVLSGSPTLLSIFTNLSKVVSVIGDGLTIVATIIGAIFGGVIYGAYSLISGIFTVIKEGAVYLWNLVTSSETLSKWINTIGNAIKKTAANIKQGFSENGITGAFNALWDSLKLGLQKYFPSLYDTLVNIRKFFRPIEDFLNKVVTKISKGFEEGGLKGAFDAIYDGFVKVFPWAENFVETIGNIPKLLGGGLKGIGGLLLSIFGGLLTIISGIVEGLSGTNFNFEAIQSKFEQFADIVSFIFEGLFGDPEEFKQRISTFVQTAWQGFLDSLENISILDVIKAFKAVKIAAFLGTIIGIATQIKDTIKELKGIPESITGMFEDAGTMFKKIGTSFQANTFVEIALALAIVAASLYGLSKIPEDKLIQAGIIVGVLMLIMAKIAKSFSNFTSVNVGDSNVKKLVDLNNARFQVLGDFASGLVGIAAIIASIGYSVAKIGNIKDPIPALEVLGVLIGEITIATMLVMSMLRDLPAEDLKNIGPTMAEIGAFMALFGASIYLLSLSISKVTEALASAPNIWYVVGAFGIITGLIVALGAVFFLLTAALSRASITGEKLKALGNTMLKIGASMVIMALAIQMLIIPILALTAIISMLGSPVPIIAASAIVVALIVVLGLMIGAIANAISNDNLNEHQIKALGNTMLKIAASMIIMVVAINMLIVPLLALVAIALIDPNALLYGCLAIAGIMIVLGSVIGIITAIITKKSMTPDKLKQTGTTILEIAASMLIVALAVRSLVGPLISLMDAFGKIGGGSGQAGLKKAGLAIGTIAAVIFVLGVALLALDKLKVNGKNLLYVSAAILAIAVALNLLIEPAKEFVQLILDVATSLSKMISPVKSFSDLFWRLMGMAAAGIVFGVALAVIGAGLILIAGSVVVGAAGILMMSAALYVFFKALDVVSEALPRFVQGLINTGKQINGDNLWDLAKGIIVLGFLAAAIYFLSKAISHLFDNAPKLMEALGKVFTAVKNGGATIGKWIIENVPKFGAALLKIVGNIASSLLKVLPKIFTAIGGWVKNNSPILLKMLGGLVTIVGLYLVGLLPRLVNILGRGIVTLFESLYQTMAANKGALEHSIFGMIELVMEMVVDAITWAGSFLIGIIFNEVQSFLNDVANLLDSIGFGGTAKSFRDAAGFFDGFMDTVHEEWERGRAEREEAWRTMIPDAQEYVDTTEIVTEQVGDANAALAEEVNNLYDSFGELTPPELDTEGFALDVDSIKSSAEGLTGAFTDVADAKTFLEGLNLNSEDFNLDLDLLSDNDIIGLANKIKDEIPGVFENLPTGAAEGINNTKDEFITALTNMDGEGMTALMTHAGINSPAEEYAKIAEYIPEGVKVGVERNSNAPAGAMKTLVDRMSAPFKNIDITYYGHAIQAINGLVRGVNNNIRASYNAGVSLANAMNRGFTTRLQIHSPSRVFEKLAEYIPLGAARGVENEQGAAIESVVILGNELQAAMQRAMAGVSIVADENFTFQPSIVPVVDMSNANAAASLFNSMFNSRTVSSALQQIGDVGSMSVNGASITYTNQNRDVVSAIQELTDKVNRLGDEMTNMQIILDTGVLVGKTTTAIDNRLGILAMQKGRGI